MTQGASVDFHVYAGPGARAPYPAVTATFESPFTSTLDRVRAGALLAEMLPADLAAAVAVPDAGLDLAHLAAALANTLQDRRGPCGLPVEIDRLEGARARIVLGYVDDQAALRALHTGLQIAGAVFARAFGGPDRRADVADLVRQNDRLIRPRQPDFIARALMRVAKRRGIPVYPVAPGSATWLYGQGSAGVQLFESASEHDSLTGARLAQDKFLSNQLLLRLGLPGVVHHVAADARTAARFARDIGYPVVVKPADQGKGRGITANVVDEAELMAAFARAREHSERGVIVERHVAGEDHRLAVFAGRFRWAARRAPPRIVGDGRHTVAQLIDSENRQRTDADVAAGYVTRLALDADMRAVLAKQGLAVDDTPAPGRVVALRAIANTATGGTVTDCTASIHPDNRELAEAIARGLRLDAVGIDFMTPDITRSWRDVECAVLEVNRTPGFSSDGRAEIILAARFPDESDGRVPSVVLVDAPCDSVGRVAAAIAATRRRVGSTDAQSTAVAGALRRPRSAELPARVLALVLDPSVDALVIGASSAELERHGFPLDRCDLALVGDRERSAELRRLIESCSGRTLRWLDDRFECEVMPALGAMLERRRAPGLPQG
jgi:cyanophycin synthetase